LVARIGHQIFVRSVDGRTRDMWNITRFSSLPLCMLTQPLAVLMSLLNTVRVSWS
jgi:hypothetical protein